MHDEDARVAPSAGPIAIVGMACRFPGGIATPEQFWQLLLDGVDTVGEVPASRFDVERYFHHKAGTPGRIQTRMGAFLGAIDGFDAGFFGISPREAERMDPQQRLLLEVAWETFEDAGIPPERASLSERTGVFIGMMENGYEDLLFRDPPTLEVLGLNGAGRYASAGRISYCFRLSGPSFSVDTACSSSLVSVHLACQSLRAGECSLALAGGAHLILQPHISICFSQADMLAADGRCKFGDAGADGFGRGEGVGLVLLEPLERAIEHGHTIYAVIRGGAVGSYGLSNEAMPRPSVEAQAANLRAAYRAAGVAAKEVQYVEAHGTGTRAGDETELRALGEVLGEGRASAQPLTVGSVKTNIAHTEAASGVASLMKVALSLQRRYLPRSLHFQTPNPNIPWSELPLSVQSGSGPWPEPEGRALRLAGINNFGISGTNAHLVVEEWSPPSASHTQTGDTPESAQLLALSARDPDALRDLALAFQPLFRAGDAGRVAEIARAAGIGRTHHRHRLSIVASSAADFDAGLEAHLRTMPRPGVMAGVKAAGTPDPKLAFVFSGHGSQWLGMGRRLLGSDPAFTASLEASDAAIRRYADWSLLDELNALPDESHLADNAVVQPVLFAVAVAIAAVWRAWGVEPDAVVGHSMGEIAAAHVAGALTLDDAARIVCLRSQLLARITGKGRMVMVELSEAEARQAIGERTALISVAVIQSERATVLSGERVALEELVSTLEARGVFCRWVKVDYASHSPHVDPLRDDLLASLAPVQPRAGRCPIYSTLLGRTIDGSTCDAQYWYENLRQPVRFSIAIAQLVSDRHTLMVEVSPHPLLAPAIAPAVREGLVVPSLRRDQDERTSLLEALGALYTAGYSTQFERLYPARDGGGPLLKLPTYPFQRQRYWFTHSPQRAERAGHPLIGSAVTSSLDARIQLFDTLVAPDELPYLSDHKVETAIVMPAVAYLEMAHAAARAVFATGTISVEALELAEPLVFLDGQACNLQLALTQQGADQAEFSISSRQGAEAFLCHARGAIVRTQPSAADGGDHIVADARAQFAAVQARTDHAIEPEHFYAELNKRGLRYGPSFRGLKTLSCNETEAFAAVELPETPARDSSYALHPALLDACLHPLLALLPAGAEGPFVPAALRAAHIRGPLGTTVFSHVVLTHSAADHLECNIRLLDGEGRVAVELTGLKVVQLQRRALDGELLFSLELAPMDMNMDMPASVPGRAHTQPAGWLLVADASERAVELQTQLLARGEAAELIAHDDAFKLRSAKAWTDRLARSFPSPRACLGVIYFASVEQAETADLSDLERGFLAGPGGVLHLVQAVTAMGWRDPPRLYLVTRGVQPSAAGGHVAALWGSSLLGLRRVLAYEHPELRPTGIDLAVTSTRADALAALILADGPVGELALRPDGLFSVQLSRTRAPARRTQTAAIRADRTYLITGGLGGLGRTLATWLIERGAKHLCLIGRTGTSGPVVDLSSDTVQVHFTALDVADRAGLARLLAGLSVPLGGVFHTAGVLDDGLLVGQSVARFRAVMQPKVLGAWNLHQLTRDQPLEHFVLYSSATSLLGTPGQSGYAAANAFLDGLAHHRRALGLPALSIDWGAFSDVGLAASQDNRGERLRARGLGSLTPAEGTAALGELLEAGTRLPAQLAVMRFDARQWIEFHPQLAGSSFFGKLANETDHGEAQPTPLLDRLRALADQSDLRRHTLEDFITGEAARVLRTDPSEIERRSPLRAAGFDSLMGLELRNRLETALDLRLAATLLWVHPTVDELTVHLIQELFGAGEAAHAPAADAQLDQALQQQVHRLSAEEQEALLEQTLAELALETATGK